VADLKPVDYSMWKYKEGVQNMHHLSGQIETATENNTGQSESRQSIN